MAYVDGFVMVVPKKNIAAYKKMAKVGKATWLKMGALDYKECMLDDAKGRLGSQILPFPKLVKAKPNETVWFSFIVFKSRKHRDLVNKKVDAAFAKEYANVKDFVMPFDEKRMSYGGFTVEL